MLSFRFYPLLALGATGLMLTACGGNDDASTQAGATESSAAAAPATTTAPHSTPATTEPDASAEADGGSTASSSETAAIRGTLISLQEAFAERDGKKACSLMVGIPKKADPKAPGGLSCETLGVGPRTPLSEENRRIAATAKVTVDGNNAIAEIGPGVPMKLRKIDGRWRVDYSDLAKPVGSSG